jgi:recombination protein RecA
MPVTSASTLDTKIEYIPSGIPSFDKVMGGGFARGKVTVVSGQPSVGKSTLVMSACAEAQKLGLAPLIYDVEYSYDKIYAESLGVDQEKMWVIREDYAEEGLDEVLAAIENGSYAIIVIDSMGALLPRADAEKSSGEKTIGSQASITARFMRKVVAALDKKKVALVLLTHEFTDIMSGKVMASGGAKMMYHASMHVRLKPKFNAIIKQGDVKVGKVITMEVKKNKLGPTEAKEADAHFMYGEAFSKTADLLDTALDKGVITKVGNTHYFGDVKLGLIGKVRKMLNEDPEFVEKLKALI